MRESGPYGRLGGAFAIRSVLDHFSDVRKPIVGEESENPDGREWHHDSGQTPGPRARAEPVGLQGVIT